MKSLLSIIIITGVVTGIALYGLFPDFWFPWYPLVPSFFVVLGIVMCLGMKHYNQLGGRKVIVGFMMMRGIKMASTLCFILLYYWIINKDITNMALTTCGFYLHYLVAETYLHYRSKDAQLS